MNESSTLQNFLPHLHESCAVNQRILHDAELVTGLSKAVATCIAAYRNGCKLLIAGNGGSAADAQHFAGELVSRFYFDRPALAAIALTTDSSILTAIGNDYGYEDVFSRQVQAHGRRGDVFLAISTSGNSPNILKAIEKAKTQGMIIVGMTGATGGKMADLCQILLNVPSKDTPRIQEAHILIGHILCHRVEKTLFD